MEKKAVLGNLIISFPVMIAVILITGIFVVLAVLLSLGGPDEQSASSSTGNNLLVENVQIDGKKMLVFDALMKYDNGDVSWSSLGESFKGLVNEKNSCLFLMRGDSPDTAHKLLDSNRYYFIFYYDKSKGKVESLDFSSVALNSRYRDSVSLSDASISFKGESKKIMYFQYYYGKCPEVKNE